MNAIKPFSLNLVWLALLLATGLTAWIAGFDGGSNWSTSSILMVASAKIALVMLYFMELKHAPQPWQWAFAAWLFAVSVIVVLGFIAA